MRDEYKKLDRERKRLDDDEWNAVKRERADARERREMQDMERKYLHNYMWLRNELRRRPDIIEEQTFKKQTRQAVKNYI